MTRVKKAVASRKRRKRLLKQAKGFFGDRKNHIRQAKDTVMKALAYNYEHRKQKKNEMRKLWIIRISAAAKINGISYNRFINGLSKASCEMNRKQLSELAIHDPKAFSFLADTAKKALSAS